MADIQSTTSHTKERDTVEYRGIPGFIGYRVGDDGSVWSCKIPGGHGRQGEWFLLSSYISSTGYWCVYLSQGRKMKCCYVHRLMLTAFVGPCPNGMEARHLNGIRSDNRVSNLAWGTRSQNAEDKVEHGTDPTGSRNPAAKLNEQMVRWIREQILIGRTASSIAEDIGVKRATVSDIKIGRTWKHVQD